MSSKSSLQRKVSTEERQSPELADLWKTNSHYPPPFWRLPHSPRQHLTSPNGPGVHLSVYTRSRAVIHCFIFLGGCYLGSGERKEGRVVREAVRESKPQKAPAQGLWQLLPPGGQSQAVFPVLNPHAFEGAQKRRLFLPVNWRTRFLVFFVRHSHSFPTQYVKCGFWNKNMNL